MKITKALIGKTVKLTWEDPTGGRERYDLEKAPKGRAALAKWEEYGVIDDISEGVVRLCHSFAFESPTAPAPDEGIFGWIVEELITDCKVLEERKDEPGPT